MSAAPLVRPSAVLTHARFRTILVAGIAWGAVVAAGLTALDVWRCGVICLDSAAFTTLLSAAIGIITIGPLAAIGHSTQQNWRTTPCPRDV